MIDRPIALAAAGFVVAGQNGDAFQKSGFSGPVFPDDDGDGTVETQLEIILQERQTERIGSAVGDARWIEPDPLEVRRGQTNVPLVVHAPAPPALLTCETPAWRHQLFRDRSFHEPSRIAQNSRMTL